MDEEIERVLNSAYGFTTVDMTARATILWAKAESDWLAGRASEALQTAEECRALPVTGFPTHVMVEPVRQWAALDLGLDPGEPLSDLLFPNLVAANKESHAIVAMYHDPENSGNAGQFLAAAKSWERMSRRNSARCGLGAGGSGPALGRHRTVRHDPAHPRARSSSRAAGGRCCGGSTRCCGCSASPSVRTPAPRSHR